MSKGTTRVDHAPSPKLTRHKWLGALTTTVTEPHWVHVRFPLMTYSPLGPHITHDLRTSDCDTLMTHTPLGLRHTYGLFY